MPALAAAYGVEPSASTNKEFVAVTTAADVEAYAKYLRETKGIVDIRTLHKSGTGPVYLDVAIVSAGFKADQMGDFHEACERCVKGLLSCQPWARYRSLVNIHAVFVGDESVDSTRLKVHGYKGNVLGCDPALAVEYARYAAPAAATVVMHNSGFSTAANDTWGVDVINKSDVGAAIHELGHGFAGLGDEYIQINGPFDGDAKDLEETTVDVTAYENPRLCKWHYWVEPEWPGIFGPLPLPKGVKVANCEGAGWIRGIYRPEKTCMMRCDGPFCVVCAEALEANFFRYAELFQTVEPGVGESVLWQGESVDFRLRAMDLLRQPPEWLKSRLSLYLDGERVASSERGEVAYQLRSLTSSPGTHQLGANLNVQSAFVRRDFGFMSGSRCWRVTVLPYKKPELVLQARVSVPAGGALDVPVKIKHVKPELFSLTMRHAPAGASFEKGRFKWKPTGQTGSWRVDFSALDAQQHGVTASMEIAFERADPGAAALEVPTLEPVAAVTGQPVALRLQASAKDGGHLLFGPVAALDGVILDRYTGELSWTPQTAQAGPQRMRFRVKNGLAQREAEVVFWVRRDATPSPVSFCNQYRPQMVAALEQLKQGPLLYRRLFETLRLMRDRYAPVHQPALAAAQALYPELVPKLRDNCLEELNLHAWEFANKPAVLKWMREIAMGEKTEQAGLLIKRLEQINSYNVRRVQEAADDDRRRAKERSEALVGVVNPWQMSKVYADGNKNCRELVACVFPPEKGPAPDAEWITAGTFPDGTLNIKNALDKAKVQGQRENCAVYLRATLEMPISTEARLELGSDDGIKVWLNGKEVFANPTDRPLVMGQDKVTVRLDRGLNTLLMKITQGGSNWEAYARVRAKDGSGIPQLKIGLPR